MDKTCPCGKVFFVETYLLERKKFCCKTCFYKYRTRPSGLKYKIVSVNKGWFAKGIKPWSSTVKGLGIMKKNVGSFKKGERRGILTEFKKGEKMGFENIKWRGEEVGYYALHTWVQRKLGKAKKCSDCMKTRGRIEWANKSHEYRRDIEDWIQLCKKCHAKYDKDTWGLATKKFNLNKK